MIYMLVDSRFLDVTLIWNFLQPYTWSVIMEIVKVPGEMRTHDATIRQCVNNSRASCNWNALINVNSSENAGAWGSVQQFFCTLPHRYGILSIACQRAREAAIKLHCAKVLLLAYLEILSSRRMIFFIREKAPRILGETFRLRAERHNVAIHPYFHVLCVISLSVSYGSALFSGTESANCETQSATAAERS